MKLTSAIVDTPAVRYEVQHALAVILYAFFGAFVGYLQAEPTTAITAAVMHWDSAKPMLIGAIVAGIVATLAQAQKSFFTSAAAVLPWVGAMTVAVAVVACTPEARAPIENDFTVIAACVEDQVVNKHAADAGTVIAACGSVVPNLVLDILRAFFGSPKAATLPAPQLESLKKTYSVQVEAARGSP